MVNLNKNIEEQKEIFKLLSGGGRILRVHAGNVLFQVESARERLLAECTMELRLFAAFVSEVIVKIVSIFVSTVAICGGAYIRTKMISLNDVYRRCNLAQIR